MIVVDASVLAVALVDDGVDGSRARSALRSANAVVIPDLANVETVAVLRKRWVDKTITHQRFAQAVRDLTDLPMHRFASAPFLERAVELRATITAYDAMYVALAEALECRLVTGDAKLASAPGPRCGIDVLAAP